jgi:hypothetical protein
VLPMPLKALTPQQIQQGWSEADITKNSQVKLTKG